MERPSSEALLRTVASLCPLPGAASRLQAGLEPMLASASLFISPRLYSRFIVSVIVLLTPAEALVLLLLPLEQSALILGAMATVEVMPWLMLLSRANSRRRSTEAELPFFLMALSVFVHEANPTLQEGFRRVSALGGRVFPAFTREGQMLARDDAFVPGSPMGVAEKAFAPHPSARVRTFVQGFLKTLATGREVSEFVRQETSYQVQKLEQSWSSFSGSVGSLAEVTFILLALFPVGLEMVGATVSGLATSLLFLASLALLGVTAAVFLFLTDSIQPMVYDRPSSALWLGVCLGSWGISTAAFHDGVLTPREYVLVPLCVSLLALYQTRRHHSRIRKGEREMSAMLHDLAEESKAGVSLPEALSKLGDHTGSFSSIEEAILDFHQATRLGLTPMDAQARISHPSWLVRLGFGILSLAFETGAGFEHLEELASLFRRVVEARRSVTLSMLPFLLVGAIVPVISVAAITFLSGFAQQSVPVGLPVFAVQTSQASLILSVSTVSALSGILLSKLLTQTVRHQLAFPILMASTLVSLFAFGIG